MNIFVLKNEILNTCKDSYRDGKKMVQDPKFLKKIEKYINKVKAEATYFFEANGNRMLPLLLI